MNGYSYESRILTVKHANNRGEEKKTNDNVDESWKTAPPSSKKKGVGGKDAVNKKLANGNQRQERESWSNWARLPPVSK